MATEKFKSSTSVVSQWSFAVVSRGSWPMFSSGKQRAEMMMMMMKLLMDHWQIILALLL